MLLMLLYTYIFFYNGLLPRKLYDQADLAHVSLKKSASREELEKIGCRITQKQRTGSKITVLYGVIKMYDNNHS